MNLPPARRIDLSDCHTFEALEARLRPWLQQHYEDAAREQATTLLMDAAVDPDMADEIISDMCASVDANIDAAIESVRRMVERDQREREVRAQVRQVLGDAKQREEIVEQVVARLCRPDDRS